MGTESSEEDPRPSADTPALLTSYHARRARGGDRQSLSWLIGRLQPVLIATAEYRLGRTLRALYAPEDIVSDAWTVAIPRLAELSPRDERFTPVLMKFLGSTILYRINNLVHKHVRGKPARQRASAGEEGDILDGLASPRTSASRIADRNEVREQVAECLSRLEPRDRELIILRGIEQHSYREIAAILGAPAASLAVTYQRALEKLRRELPGSIYEEFGND